MTNLTPKQEKFAQKYIELGNASEAYRQAYNAENMGVETIHVAASQLLAKHKVSIRVEELRLESAARHAVTVDSITKELEEARAIAITEKQTASAVSASNSKAKLHGLLDDSVKFNGKLEINVKKTVRSADRD